MQNQGLQLFLSDVVWKTPQRQPTEKNQTQAVTLVMENHGPPLTFYIGVVLNTTSWAAVSAS